MFSTITVFNSNYGLIQFNTKVEQFLSSYGETLLSEMTSITIINAVLLYIIINCIAFCCLCNCTWDFRMNFGGHQVSCFELVSEQDSSKWLTQSVIGDTADLTDLTDLTPCWRPPLSERIALIFFAGVWRIQAYLVFKFNQHLKCMLLYNIWAINTIEPNHCPL